MPHLFFAVLENHQERTVGRGGLGELAEQEQVGKQQHAGEKWINL